MNVYEKIAEARVRFQSLGVKMSGQNKFAGYNYFELSDILPAINKIGKELGFVCIVSFSTEAALKVVNTEKPDEYALFTSPMSTANLKGCHEVQNLGAVETYIKRYLYQNAFEIVEADALNATHGEPGKPQQKEPPVQYKNNTAENMAEAKKLGEELGLSDGEKKELVSKNGNDLQKVVEAMRAMKTERVALNKAADIGFTGGQS